MNQKDYQKTIDELNLEKKQNEEKICINDERKRMSYANQIDYNLLKTFCFSMLPYFIIVTTLTFMDANLAINYIPKEIIPILITSSSLGIGSILTHLQNKKYHVKERFQSFSKAKKQTEKIEEEVYYQIEQEKAKNRNKIIEKVIDTIETNQELLNTLLNKHNINEKQVTKIPEESIEILKGMSKTLEDKYTELDILTTKKVLNDNFWKVRLKANNIMDILIASGCGAIGTLMLTSFIPIMSMSNIFQGSTLLVKNTYFYASLIIGALGGTIYWTKRSKDRKEAFLRLNKTLGNRALFEIIKFDNNESEQFEKMIEKTMNDICVMEVQFREQKRMVENLEKTETTEKTNQIDRILDETPQQDITTQYGINNTPIEVEQFEEEQEQFFEEIQTAEVPKPHKRTRTPRRK